MSTDTIRVRYIGLKAKCTDSFPDGKVYTWIGNDDVQTLPAAALPKVQKHPTVWEIVADEPAKHGPGLADASAHEDTCEPAADAQPAADLSAMDVDELREWAKANGKKIDGRLKSADAIRAQLMAA